MPLVIRELVLTIRSTPADTEPENFLDRLGDLAFGDEREEEDERDALIRDLMDEQHRIERQRQER